MREGAALLVLQEYAGDASDGEGIMVAVRGQLAAVELGEKLLFGIDSLKLGILPHPGVAHLTVQRWIVIAYNVDIEQVFDMRQWHHGMLHEERGPTQVGILS